MNNHKNTKGFTIIEVVLVLAIAGLIFLMVFIALPALQRTQRDSARQEEVSTVIAAIGTYSSLNNGKLPSSATSIVSIVEGASGTTLASGTTVTVYSDVSSAPTVTGTKESGTPTSTSLPYDNIVVYNKYKCSTADASNKMTLVKGTARQAAALAFLESGVIYCRNN